MNLDTALDVAHVMRRQNAGNSRHCNEPTCSACACIVLAAEVRSQRQQIAALSRVMTPTPVEKWLNNKCGCGEEKVDGICARCDL